MWICIVHRCEHASDALPLPVCRRWSPPASRSARHQHHTARPWIRASVSCDVLVYSPSFRRVLIPACHGGWAQTEYTWVHGSVPRWFTCAKTVTHRGTTLIESNVLPLHYTGNYTTTTTTTTSFLQLNKHYKLVMFVSFQPATDGGPRMSRPRCLVLHWSGLPVLRRSPTQALTGTSVEQLPTHQIGNKTTTTTTATTSFLQLLLVNKHYQLVISVYY